MTRAKRTRPVNRLWVVEMLAWSSERWEPTTATGLTRWDAREERQKYMDHCPDDCFRVVLYRGSK